MNTVPEHTFSCMNSVFQYLTMLSFVILGLVSSVSACCIPDQWSANIGLQYAVWNDATVNGTFAEVRLKRFRYIRTSITRVVKDTYFSVVVFSIEMACLCNASDIPKTSTGGWLLYTG